jgi:prevent-host-death family protein
MKIATAAKVKTNFNIYLEECEEGPVIVTKNGRPVAVLIAVIDDEELERLVLAHTPRFRRLLDAAEQRIQKTGGVKHDDFWKSVTSRSRRSIAKR